MVTKASVEKQLKKINFNVHGWGRTEALELHNILLDGEEIYEVANGIYEGGFAMIVATDVRVLLVDKKPFNFLTVEDLRFDMISELDYNHRLLGAHISIASGSKNLKFTSYNQARLRKLITHVQHCMADNKKQESNHQVDQKQHLEQINQQLQAYLIAQHKHQQELHERLMSHNTSSSADSKAAEVPPAPEPIKPSPELSDYLFAQSLLAEYKKNQAEQQPKLIDVDAKVLPSGEQPLITAEATPDPQPEPATTPVITPAAAMPKQTPLETMQNPQMADLYAEGMQEIFGKREQAAPAAPAPPTAPTQQAATSGTARALEINPLKIAYSKLPMALRNKRFGRPSFHSHSQQTVPKFTWPITSES